MWKGMRRFLFLSPSHDLLRRHYRSKSQEAPGYEAVSHDLLRRHYRSKSQEAPGYEAALEAQADLECCF